MSRSGAPARVYVSITGLQVRSLHLLPLFWVHATRAMSQARAAEGCLLAEARRINGIHHTRSVWIDRDHMLRYLRAGAHLRAMRDFPKIATGKTIGFDTGEVPGWAEVHQIWLDRGVDV